MAASERQVAELFIPLPPPPAGAIVLPGASEDGLDLAVQKRGSSIVLYQERRNGKAGRRALTVCSWQRVEPSEVEHCWRAARAKGVDVDAVLRMLGRRKR